MEITEIGRIHSPFKQAKGTPIQPSRAKGVEGTIQLAPQFVAGLKDLEGFDRVWLIYWFDRASVAALSVIPYRDVVERGLFSTRAPARVNPLGLSNVKLIESVWKSVAGATILVAGCCKRNSRSWL